MLRLDPAFPPLWRSATTLQFGAEAVVVIDDPSPWQQRLIRELEGGIPDAALDPVAQALGAPADAAEAFVRRIRRALARPVPPPLRICLQTPDGFPRARAAAVAAALVSAGTDVSEVTWFAAPGELVRAQAPVVVLADHIVEPRRTAALMGADVPHVPLVFTGTGAEVGPYVAPGRTPCLACLAAHRRDADPAWPHLAAQLLGRPAPQVGDALMIEASFVTAHLLIEAVRRPRRLRSCSVTLREDSLHRATRAHRPHAACRCRSLGGTATADVRAFPATTSATECAQPA
jgi:hypothetical protein